MNLLIIIPETHLIELNYAEKEVGIQSFLKVYNNDIWIIKPGEGTNRGHGIYIHKDLKKILNIINNEYSQ